MKLIIALLVGSALATAPVVANETTLTVPDMAAYQASIIAFGVDAAAAQQAANAALAEIARRPVAQAEASTEPYPTLSNAWLVDMYKVE